MTSQAQRLSYERKVHVDYMSTDGPAVVAVKAFAFQSRLAYLRESGYFEEYVKHLQPVYRQVFLEALASSWVPVDAVVAHYAALDALDLGAAQLSRSTEKLAPTLYQTFFSALLRILRGSRGGAWSGLMHADRIMSRLYQGGGLVVTQVGPKDALYELKGMPFADSRSFRLAHCEFMRGVINLTDQGCVVREMATAQPKSERYVVSISWV